MGTSIPSHIWEQKKALIVKLYKEEEWPLKHVIKRVRSGNFKPTEIQLRSRLKKWRVTKPSRQMRKKAAGVQVNPTDSNSAITEASYKIQTPFLSPRTPLHASQQPTVTAFPATEPGWYMRHEVYGPSQGASAPIFVDDKAISTSWSLAGKHPSPSLSDHHTSYNGSPVVVLGSNTLDQRHISPELDAVFSNTTSTMTHASSRFPFLVPTEACTPEQVSTTASTAPIQWTGPHLYRQPPGAICQRPQAHFCPCAPPSPLSSNLGDTAMQAPRSQTDLSIYLPDCPGSSQHRMPEDFDGAKLLCLSNIRLTKRCSIQDANDLIF